jgi:prevent-host-death family protein
MTTTVGVRELRDHLSKYLALVDAGGEVIVTDHGRVRARILAAGEETVMERLIREGKVTPPSRPKGKLRPGVKADGPNYRPGTPVASDLIER